MSITNLNYRVIARIFGITLIIIGVAMLIPWIYAEITGDSDAAYSFRLCAPMTIAVGAVISILSKSHTGKFRAREGCIVVAFCWIIASFVGAFPYYLSDFTNNFIDAFFESTAGFTTTGCTAVSGSTLSESLILWKAVTNWLGGMGILLFVISILPALGINGQVIAKAETPGPVFEKTTVRLRDSARILYITYFSFTLIEFILLLLSGKMPVYDAIVNTMGSISTGGVLVHSEGIAYYDSLYVEIVISVFCILASINFIMYHYVMAGKFNAIIKNIELRAYLIIIASAIILCAAGLWVYNDESPAMALRDSFFQVISMATTAGYVRSPYIIWPTMCQIILIALMFTGGCAASTSGSVKLIRVLVMFKLIWRGCVKRIHPRSVVPVKIADNILSAAVVSQITVFLLTYMLIFLLSSFVLSFQGLDLETTITATLALLSNTGCGFGETAAMGSFSMFHPALKLYLSFLMIVGRLELFTIVVLFTRNFWGHDR